MIFNAFRREGKGRERGGREEGGRGTRSKCFSVIVVSRKKVVRKMSERTNRDDSGNAMMDEIHQHEEVKILADISEEIDRIAYSSEDEVVKQLCRETNKKLLELSTKMIARWLEAAGF